MAVTPMTNASSCGTRARRSPARTPHSLHLFATISCTSPTRSSPRLLVPDHLFRTPLRLSHPESSYSLFAAASFLIDSLPSRAHRCIADARHGSRERVKMPRRRLVEPMPMMTRTLLTARGRRRPAWPTNPSRWTSALAAIPDGRPCRPSVQTTVEWRAVALREIADADVASRSARCS